MVDFEAKSGASFFQLAPVLLVPGIGLACLGLGEDLSTLVELSVTQTGCARHVRHVRCFDEKILQTANDEIL